MDYDSPANIFFQPPSDQFIDIIIPENINNMTEKSYFIFKSILDLLPIYINVKFGKNIDLANLNHEELAKLNEYIAMFGYNFAVSKESLECDIFNFILAGRKSAIANLKNDKIILPTDFFYVIQYPDTFYVISLTQV